MIARAAAGFAVFGGLLVLSGWVFHVSRLTSVFGGLASMKPNTAVSFVLAGLALWARQGSTPSAARARASWVGAAVLAAFAAATLSQDLAGWNFVVIGSALLLTPLRPAAAQALALLAAATSMIVLLGHAYDVQSSYLLAPFSSTALHTALGQAVVSAGVLSLRPGEGWFAVFSGGDPGGVVARGLLPAVCGVLVAAGGLELAGERAGLYDHAFGIALLTASSVTVLSALVWWTAERLRAVDRARRRAEDALLAEERRFEKAFRLSPAAMTLSTLEEGRYLSVNQSFLRMIGASERDVVGRRAVDVGFWRNASDREAIMRALGERGSVAGVELEIRTMTGEVRRIVLSLELLDVAGTKCVLGLSEDVTELKRRERQLRESEWFLEKAQEVGHVGSWISGTGDDTSLTWSTETYRIFGLAPGTPIDVERFFAMVHPDDREAVRAAAAAAFTGGTPYAIDYRIVRPDGAVRWVHEQAEVVRLDDGHRSMVGTVQDLTERRLLEEQLSLSQRLEAVGRLAGGIAHDFNNLLSVIVGYAHLVNRALAGGPLTSKMDEIVKASERAAALTRQLLAFARKQVLVTEVLDVVAIVSELGGMLRRLIGEDIEIVTSLRANNARTRADRSQLEQVIVNLVVNARDALPNGGRVTVEVDEATLGAAYGRDHAAVRPGSYVVLAVSDNGVGMSPEVRDRVFEPFFTTKEMGRGTGLGLATVYGIVKQSGGFIWVYSEPGQGTTFKVYLPLEHAPEAPGPRIKPPARGCETVLLVEDEDAVRELAVEVLQDAGYRVLQAPSAARAIEMAGEHPGAIDLVVTDVVMPGLGGRELGEQLVASRPGLKVLFMSGYTDDVILRRGVLSSSAAFIEKPFSPEGLARKVREVLDGGPHRGETGRAS